LLQPAVRSQKIRSRRLKSSAASNLAADNPVRGASVVERPSRITFEKYLAEMMQRLIDEKEQLSSCLPSPTPRSTTGSMGLSLVSVVSAPTKHFPRLAIVRRFTKTSVGAVSFASTKWSTPVMNVTEYALQFPGVGLVQTRDVPAWTLAEIAGARVVDVMTQLENQRLAALFSRLSPRVTRRSAALGNASGNVSVTAPVDSG
jgi:hypothetical protein